MKKLIAFTLTVVMLLSSLAFAAPAMAADDSSWGNSPSPEWTYGFQRVSVMVDNPNMYLNDAIVPVDPADATATPVLLEGVVYLPLSAAKVALGAGTVWEVTAETVTATSGDKTATLAVGTDIIVDEGVLYLPIQAIATTLGNASIGWEPVSQVMIITTGATVNQNRVSHSAMNSQQAQWYGSAESIRLAENLLLYQQNAGGWNYNDNPTKFGNVMTQAEINAAIAAKSRVDDTLDDDATINEIRYLVKVYQATKIERYRDSFMKAINLILSGQYDNGGFPQRMIPPATYHGEITYNDNAMTRALNLWLDIYKDPVSFYSVNEETYARIENSLIRAIDCILETQIYSEGKQMLTAWCAQHYRDTMKPSWARAYEPPSISGSESINLLNFLMNLDQGFLKALDDENVLGEDKSIWERVQNSIHAAVKFFAASEIYGYTIQNLPGKLPALGNTRTLVPTDGARGLWPRFMDINTFEPLLVDRDVVTFRAGEQEIYGPIVTGFMAEYKHAPANGGNLRNIYNEDGTLDMVASYANLSYERRGGYSYFVTNPVNLPVSYASWLAKNGLEAPPEPNTVGLKGTTAATVRDVAEYTLRVGNVQNLATVTAWFEVDGDYLSAKDALGLNGFETIGGVSWANTEGSTWAGRVTLGNLSGGSLTTEEYADVLKMTFDLKKVGETGVKLIGVKLSGYDENGDAVFFDAVIKNGTVLLDIEEWFSPYDINKDKVVDQLDLTTAQKYYMAAEGDANWADAKIADVNGSGKVDIEDFILILNNIVW